MPDTSVASIPALSWRERVLLAVGIHGLCLVIRAVEVFGRDGPRSHHLSPGRSRARR